MLSGVRRATTKVDDSNEAGVTAFPETDAERENVRAHLNQVLASELFSNSKRYPSLLKYIVEASLSGRGAELKERTLGVEVFGRVPTYDTNADPVVRTSAAQVRHRLAQYYEKEGRDSDVRIELQPGSYMPVFRRLDAPDAAVEPAPPATESAEGDPPPLPAQTVAPGLSERVTSRRLSYLLAGLAVCIAAAVLLWQQGSSNPVDLFWGSVWDKTNAVVICAPGRFPTVQNPTQTAGTSNALVPMSEPPLTISECLKLNSIAWPDASALYLLTGFIQFHGQRYVVRREGDSALADLKSGPVVLIGGYNNAWLMRLMSRYRFTYQSRAEDAYKWIGDAQNPNMRQWGVDIGEPYSKFEQDYGIISRVQDPTTERVVVVASGIASYGTIAAAEFLTNPKHLAAIAAKAPTGWQRRNVQVVFSTNVFNGFAGPPQILAVHVW